MKIIYVIIDIFQEIPPPGSYEVHRSFTHTQGKINPGVPRTASAKRKQGAFASSSSRFAPPRDVVLDESDPAYPGQYENKTIQYNVKRNVINLKQEVPSLVLYYWYVRLVRSHEL